MATTTWKKRKKRRKSKLSKLGRSACLIVVALIAWGVTLDAAPKKKERAPAGIIAGTVFQASGRLLQGAKVEAVSQADAKIKSNILTDIQGDFAIRVPAGSYVVTATAKGFQSQEKTVEVSEGEKIRTNLILEPAESGSKN
jgi:Carboxypeptidase regulatory-like domain